MSVPDAAATADRVIDEILSAVVADETVLEEITAGLLARGHVLLEDVPGTGKTLTARSFATALGLDFSRIQFTPDLMPSDVTGSYVFEEGTGEFHFTEGPVFANVVLADEINRAPPKTQSALLEAMAEDQVTVDGETHELPDPFIVIATQNPVEQEGTFELPEAQRDRFMIKTSLGYPDPEGTRELIDRRADRDRPDPTVDRVVDLEQVRDLQEVPETVTVDGPVRDYIGEVCRATRRDGRVDVGVSPRGVQRLFEVSRARAVLEGREYVVPDDVKHIAPAAIAHRLVLTPEASVEGASRRAVVESVLDHVEVPAMDPDSADSAEQ
ncbi:AAA family ATPase [Halopiger xanaduensis]|uniref:ATPase associated with various cellular activities AAA_3 n=1 Tax=Halopiger xanaduensis (strain DSM 18323 / JCM 14033 / SH-6) TaxID=797210 RepID=F8D5U1_HALXS|nr:MoxR family ATPase [Halopiger xanaduensis]AEH36522.1 ATPase associated with various cellular activities AAA_3 [Halopiger xanaduensis SH-6]